MTTHGPRWQLIATGDKWHVSPPVNAFMILSIIAWPAPGVDWRCFHKTGLSLGNADWDAAGWRVHSTLAAGTGSLRQRWRKKAFRRRLKCFCASIERWAVCDVRLVLCKGVSFTKTSVAETALRDLSTRDRRSSVTKTKIIITSVEQQVGWCIDWNSTKRKWFAGC